jgi:NAD(P)-dependent dehydrogenase (short-subunit alcohol dehydrogenase family)
MDLGLKNKTIVVTGGSSGIGLATVRVALGDGANVALC